MLSKSRIKYIHSLKLKKNRLREGLFIAEGRKIVSELLDAPLRIRDLYACDTWLRDKEHKLTGISYTAITEDELKKISQLQSPDQVLAIVEKPPEHYSQELFRDKWTLALDHVQDPGNLGTIIRLADWFGINTIFCSPDTVDTYNSKTIQATMGSIARVQICTAALPELLNECKADGIPIYGTLLEGESTVSGTLDTPGMILMGNESKGISEALLPFISQQVSIPKFKGADKIDSLNVAIATAILLYEVRRPEFTSYGLV